MKIILYIDPRGQIFIRESDTELYFGREYHSREWISTMYDYVEDRSVLLPKNWIAV